MAIHIMSAHNLTMIAIWFNRQFTLFTRQARS